MINELHNKSLKELRVLYPGIKSTSKDGFIFKLETSTAKEKIVKDFRMTPSKKQEVVITVDGGVGDMIARVLDSPAIKPITKAVKKVIFKDGEDCGCKERKVKLNQLFKYKLKPRCFTESEYKQWGKFKNTLTLKIEYKQIKYICKTYSEVMQRQYFEPCLNCSPKPLIYMIDNLNVVYDSYK